MVNTNLEQHARRDQVTSIARTTVAGAMADDSPTINLIIISSESGESVAVWGSTMLRTFEQASHFILVLKPEARNVSQLDFCMMQGPAKGIAAKWYEPSGLPPRIVSIINQPLSPISAVD
jgi:hypothetical protein